MPLVVCRTAKPGPSLVKLSDSGGLQLWVQPKGSPLWRLAYRFGGKQKLLAFGAYPALSLADARRLRDEAKRLLANGVDPSIAKRHEKVARRMASDTFRSVAEEYISKRKREGKATTGLLPVPKTPN